MARNLFGDLELEPQPFRPGVRSGTGARLRDELVECEVGRVDLEVAGLDLGEVEDVVDDREHLFARARDMDCARALLRREIHFEQQLGHPEYPVHRRADLVAHVREECGFHVRRLDGLVVCGRELCGGALAFGDVVKQHDAVVAALEHEVRADRLHVDDRAILVAVTPGAGWRAPRPGRGYPARVPCEERDEEVDVLGGH